MFDVLILICAASLTQAECQKTTAMHVIKGPAAANLMTCGLHGQAYLAETSLAYNLENSYVKIRCTPSARPMPTARLDSEPLD